MSRPRGSPKPRRGRSCSSASVRALRQLPPVEVEDELPVQRRPQLGGVARPSADLDGPPIGSARRFVRVAMRQRQRGREARLEGCLAAVTIGAGV